MGELLNIEHAVERMGAWLQKKFSGMGRITEGFVTGTLVFAVGAMAVMGGLDSGLKNDHTILFAKSIIDCVSAVAFASSMGIGVAFAGGSVLLVEGAERPRAAVSSVVSVTEPRHSGGKTTHHQFRPPPSPMTTRRAV